MIYRAYQAGLFCKEDGLMSEAVGQRVLPDNRVRWNELCCMGVPEASFRTMHIASALALSLNIWTALRCWSDYFNTILIAVSNRRYKLDEEISEDPKDTAFFKAMKLCKGVASGFLAGSPSGSVKLRFEFVLWLLWYIRGTE